MKKAVKKSPAKAPAKKAPKKTSTKKVAAKAASTKSVKKHSIADQVSDMAGSKFGDLCDYLAETNKKANLASLLGELETATGVVQDLIDEVGKNTLLSDAYSK